MTAPYRSRVNALAVITSAAFFGANAFIGLSMGVYWLSLPPADFVAQFFPSSAISSSRSCRFSWPCLWV
jgi:hypothetical protein